MICFALENLMNINVQKSKTFQYIVKLKSSLHVHNHNLRHTFLYFCIMWIKNQFVTCIQDRRTLPYIELFLFHNKEQILTMTSKEGDGVILFISIIDIKVGNCLFWAPTKNSLQGIERKEIRNRLFILNESQDIKCIYNKVMKWKWTIYNQYMWSKPTVVHMCLGQAWSIFIEFLINGIN